jgi:hypothetical protein
MRRHRLHPAAAALVVAAGALLPAGVATAQTTTTTAPPATTVPTTVAPTTPPTTAAPTTTTTGGATPGTTTAPAVTTVPALTTSGDDGGSDIPWVPIAIGVGVLALVVVVVAVLARKRGATRQRSADWRRNAADATAEAGATARLLSQGTPPSGQIAQQLLAALRAFEDLARSAPNESDAATAERARRALQTLGLAIDSDYRLRRAQPPADASQLAQSRESVQDAAGEADRALRGVYRTFTGAE